MENHYNEICTDLELKTKKNECSKLIVEHCDDVQVLQQILIASITYSNSEMSTVILSKITQLKIEKKELFNYIDHKGCNALYYCALKGNTKFAKIILDEIDTKTKQSIDYLSAFKSYDGHNLMHACCKSGNMDIATLILSIFTFPKDINALLMARNNNGNNPLHTYLANIKQSKCEQLKHFVLWYLSNVDEKNKLSLISNINFQGSTALTAIENTPFGKELFELIVSDCMRKVTDGDISDCAVIVRDAFRFKKPLKLLKRIVDSYKSTDKMKLFSIKDDISQKNVFDLIKTQTDLDVLQYLLSFITPNNCTILTDADGPLHQCISESIPALMILEKCNSNISDILSIKTDSGSVLLSSGERKMHLIILNELINTQYLIQYLVDRFPNDVLFYYIQDHEDELMPNLLWQRTEHNETLLMRMVESRSRDRKYMCNWLLSWIKKLNANDIRKMITATNITGDTALHFAAKSSDIEVVKELLSLIPQQQLKEDIILKRNHKGESVVAVAQGGTTYILWNNLERLETKLRLAAQIFEDTTQDNNKMNMKDWIKSYLKRHPKSDAYIDDIDLLVSLFRYALVTGDTSFARWILSRIDIGNKDKIIAFLSTKSVSANDECCLHFACKCKYLETLQVLFVFMDVITNEDMTKLLLDETIVYDWKNKTPLMIACELNNVYMIRYLLSRIENETDKLNIIEMETEYDIDDEKVTLNAILIACWKSRNIECLKELLSHYKQLAPVIKYRNNKNQSIYHYVQNIETCACIQLFDKNVSFGFKAFNMADNDGITPFLQAIKNQHTTTYTFIEWILNTQCKNDDERLKLIYKHNNDGEHALDLVSDNSTKHVLISTVQNILSSYKQIKDWETIIRPMFLWSLKVGKLNLSKWLMTRLNESEQKKLLNDSNEFGMNALLSSAKGGKMSSLQFLFSHKLFHPKEVSTDCNGLSPFHYVCFRSSDHSISCLKALLEFFNVLANRPCSDLMVNIADNDGNIPIDYIISKVKGGFQSSLEKWLIQCCFNDTNDEYEAKHRIMQMLFHKNNKGEVALVEHKNLHYSKYGGGLIKQYFASIDEITDSNAEYAGYSLLYLRGERWNLQKYIISKIKDKQLLVEMLNMKNSDGYTVLHYVCATQKWFLIDWYLSEIIPDNHPILFAQNTKDHRTALMELLRNGCISLAEKLLHKIQDTKERLRLMEIKDNRNKTIFDYAKQKNIVSQMDWIQHQMTLITK